MKESIYTCPHCGGNIQVSIGKPEKVRNPEPMVYDMDITVRAMNALFRYLFENGVVKRKDELKNITVYSIRNLRKENFLKCWGNGLRSWNEIETEIKKLV